MGKYRRDPGPEPCTVETGGPCLHLSDEGLRYPPINEKRYTKRIRLKEPLTVILKHDFSNKRTEREFSEFYVPEEIDITNKILIGEYHYPFVKGRPIGMPPEYHNTNVLFVVINGEYIPYSSFRERNRDKEVRSLDLDVEITEDFSGDNGDKLPLLEEALN